MVPDTEYELNNAAFRRLKPEIDARYPAGHWVALEHGQIIANAPSYEELTELLASLGKDRPDIFVARARGYYPEFVHILLSGKA